MNHIGAKTETPSSAWDQLAQTQNFDHPIRQQTSSTTISVKPIINQTPLPQQQSSSQPTSPNIQSSPPPHPPPPTSQQQPPTTSPTDPNKPPEYGEELHPELVNKTSLFDSYK